MYQLQVFHSCSKEKKSSKLEKKKGLRKDDSARPDLTCIKINTQFIIIFRNSHKFTELSKKKKKSHFNILCFKVVWHMVIYCVVKPLAIQQGDLTTFLTFTLNWSLEKGNN